jgi:hypothetical protein
MTNQILVFLLGAAICALAFFVWHFYRQSQDLQIQCSQSKKQKAELEAKYSGIINIEAEIDNARKNVGKAKLEQQEIDAENERRRAQSSQEYEQALAKYKELKGEVSLLEENLEDISFGVYAPHFGFQTSEEYKAALEKLRNAERQMIRDGEAAVCPIKWNIGGSEQEGKRMVKAYEKLLLRAFNGECDAALANVSWNNITKMEERIRKSHEAVNKLGEVVSVSITKEYLKMKLNEIRLTYETEEKRYQEREEQRRGREELREQERAQKEIEKAREEAEREEERYQKALARAREDAAKATGAQLEKLTEQIRSMEAKLDEAHQQKERAISRAQIAKSGFVYVISNIGSFGEHVFKVGMTRRMEPMDRVHELGDASVPFPFDVHVMMYSDDAPKLEHALHELLRDRQMNLINNRREFFRNVELDEIENFVKAKGLSAQFIKHAEAREFRESLAKQQASSKQAAKQPDKFANNPFASPSVI